jgi:hypothetical protein
MEMRKTIYVKNVDGKWEVAADQESGNTKYTTSASKVDAMRYARACEQRTGVSVKVLPEN